MQQAADAGHHNPFATDTPLKLDQGHAPPSFDDVDDALASLERRNKVKNEDH